MNISTGDVLYILYLSLRVILLFANLNLFDMMIVFLETQTENPSWTFGLMTYCVYDIYRFGSKQQVPMSNDNVV